jgi:hypothetical protein
MMPSRSSRVCGEPVRNRPFSDHPAAEIVRCGEPPLLSYSCDAIEREGHFELSNVAGSCGRFTVRNHLHCCVADLVKEAT